MNIVLLMTCSIHFVSVVKICMNQLMDSHRNSSHDLHMQAKNLQKKR